MTVQTDQASAALSERRTQPDRRVGVRRQADLTGIEQAMSLGMAEWEQATVDRLAELDLLTSKETPDA